jgi:hypothetical protein
MIDSPGLVLPDLLRTQTQHRIPATPQVPVEKIIYKDRPVPVQMSPERVVVKEIPYEVDVVKEVPVPVERVVYKVRLPGLQTEGSERVVACQSDDFTQNHGSGAAAQSECCAIGERGLDRLLFPGRRGHT